MRRRRRTNWSTSTSTFNTQLFIKVFVVVGNIFFRFHKWTTFKANYANKNKIERGPAILRVLFIISLLDPAENKTKNSFLVAYFFKQIIMQIKEREKKRSNTFYWCPNNSYVVSVLAFPQQPQKGIRKNNSKFFILRVFSTEKMRMRRRQQQRRR